MEISRRCRINDESGGLVPAESAVSVLSIYFGHAPMVLLHIVVPMAWVWVCQSVATHNDDDEV
jgi:hypothetical protein